MKTYLVKYAFPDKAYHLSAVVTAESKPQAIWNLAVNMQGEIRQYNLPRIRIVKVTRMEQDNASCTS